ncbi:fimbrial assembly protein [Enterobacter sp. Ap-916]|uniref:CS1 type fimbrial major subunit n=2 Tax=Enterobacterales TaxID=91347 RepID=UPI000272976E|nr:MULTISPECIES: CS1 type fimbrial major subunit [unclassified Enterobacter]EJF29551.1 putative CS1 type fimbrial major subunit [Enterobacter sp. Ag1]NIF61075.1 fimbrial assembly protein [Enterobacter sp. Ap-867]NIG32240.1 fimbrial assembly protein [Enterobacter sp. Ap-916]
MKTQIKVISFVSVLVTTFSVNAVQRDITVTANIDPTVDVTLADGSPLPSSIAMQYLPGKGLAAHKENIKFWSNTADRALNVSLANTPSLTDANGANPIPLSVSVNGTALSTTATSLAYATTFPSGITNGSSTMPLVISQTTPGAVSAAGTYTGIVSLVVTQATAAAGG